MPGTLTPGQMFDHTGVELSGRDMMYPLDFSAPANPSEDTPVMQGGVCSVTAAGDIVTGLGDGVSNIKQAGITPMALFAIQGRDEFDANSDVGNFSGGVQGLLVASGGYEIQTTEFVKESGGSPVAYLPNEPLTFGLGDDRGLVDKAPATYSDVQVIGVVSNAAGSDVNNNEYDKAVINFWTVFCPAVNLT